MAAYVLSRATELGSKPALEQPGFPDISYSELLHRVQSVAGGLLDRGLSPGDHVLFRLGNSAEFPVAYLACIWAGLIPFPLSSALTTVELDALISNIKPDLILLNHGISMPSQRPCPVLDCLPTCNAVTPDMGSPDRLAYVIFTSGTSGRPRGVRHAHRAIWARRHMWDGWYGMTEQDRVLHAGAFNWTYTLGTGLMDPWSLGATAIIPPPGTSNGNLPSIINTSKASIFAAAPGVYRQILKSSLPQMPSLRHGLSAGEALPRSIRNTWRDATSTDIHEALGMSECSTFISGNPQKPAEEGSVGRPQPGRTIAALKTGTPVQGEPGHLAIALGDPGLMIGYLDASDLSDPWFETGDMVEFSTKGEIKYLGRSDDMMNAGGYRVSPLEVEAAFAPLLPETACVSVEIKPDTYVITLFYTSPTELPDRSLRAHAQTVLAKYKQPRLYIHCANLPKGGNGKLNRRLLRERFEAPNGKA